MTKPRQYIDVRRTKRVVLYVVVALVAVFGAIAAFRLWKTTTSATVYYQRGFAEQAKGDLDGAIADYNQAIKLNPRHAYAYNNRGLARQTKGDLNGAIADYDRAIELNSSYANPYNNRGLAKSAQGDLDSAITDYNRAIKLNSTYTLAYNNRGVAKSAKGNLDGAIADYDSAIKLDPNDSRAYYNRGIARQDKGDLGGAVADFDNAIELDPKNAQSYCTRGFARRMKGDLDGALADCGRAIELDPKNRNAYYGRGVALYDKRDWNGALADFHKVSALKPADSRSETLQDYSQIRIWMTRAKLGERDAATNELKQYLLTRSTAMPNDWLATIARALTGDVSESDLLKAADSGDAKQAQSQRCEAYFYAGALRLFDGDKSTATDYFKKCLETHLEDYYEYQSAAAELEFLKQ